jgi:peptide/nickel transport system substrate-binding protein
MKRCFLILFAASNIWWSVTTFAASRPHYGGTLRLAVKESPTSVLPAELAASGLTDLSRSVFETLVALDGQGHAQPLLATSWQPEPGNQRWHFFIRPGVNFSDGTPLDSTTVAASLRAADPEWKVLALGETIMIETESPDANVPAELALARNGIVHRTAEKPVGTGAFSIGQFDPGKHATLKANDQCWGGRPFLDSVEVDFSKSYREQMMLLDLGKADVVEVAPDNLRRAQAEGRITLSSQPSELMALVFAAEPRSEDELHARNALATSIDTAAITNVVLQSGGEPTGALLPNWVSGYAFVFSAGGEPDHAHHERLPAPHLPSWTLRYDASDPIAHVIAERILLNARDAGITLQLASSSIADLRLVRIPLPSTDPQVVLAEFARTLQLPSPKFAGNSTDDLYPAENTLLQSHRVFPLLHLRTGFALRPHVRNWITGPDGTWTLDNVWLSPEQP